jgi:hypothetical protein
VQEKHGINLNTELYFLFETRGSDTGQSFLVASWKEGFSSPTGLARMAGCLSAKC